MGDKHFGSHRNTYLSLRGLLCTLWVGRGNVEQEGRKQEFQGGIVGRRDGGVSETKLELQKFGMAAGKERIISSPWSQELEQLL